MKIIQTKIKDAIIIEPNIFKDDRGYFLETFRENNYIEIIGDEFKFVQDSLSVSKHSVLRGMHFQKNTPQGKLLYLSEGEIYDVIVDLRKDSDTFGDWFSINLSNKDHKQLWIPPGLAHGFYVISTYAKVHYKLTTYYDPSDEFTLAWNDPTINIRWPNPDPLINKKDQSGLTFSEINN